MKIVGKYLDADSFKINSASGNGSTTAFNLTDTPISLSVLQVYVNGLIQQPTADYSLSGNQVTFTTAPAAGQEINFHYIKG